MLVGASQRRACQWVRGPFGDGLYVRDERNWRTQLGLESEVILDQSISLIACEAKPVDTRPKIIEYTAFWKADFLRADSILRFYTDWAKSGRNSSAAERLGPSTSPPCMLNLLEFAYYLLWEVVKLQPYGLYIACYHRYGDMAIFGIFLSLSSVLNPQEE